MALTVIKPLGIDTAGNYTAGNYTVITNHSAFTLVYYNVTQGWILTNV